MSWWISLILIVGSIVFYTHILPILDRISEYIQAIILTKKMGISVKYTEYEVKVNNLHNECEKKELKKAIGFQVQNEEDYEEDETDDE